MTSILEKNSPNRYFMKDVLLNIGRVGHWRASAKRFKDIFDRVPLSAIIAMYPTFHEMDISRFIASMDRGYDESVSDTKLKKICLRNQNHFDNDRLFIEKKNFLRNEDSFRKC